MIHEQTNISLVHSCDIKKNGMGPVHSDKTTAFSACTWQ